VPQFTEIDEDSIKALVHRFYERVRADAELGPVFDGTIAEAGWPAHLSRMCAFWSSVMLTSGRYSGNPVSVHRGVQGITPTLFPRWLELFTNTAETLFPPDLAAAFADKARRIAASLQMAVFYRPGDRPDAATLGRVMTAPV
jgi:hemoglobin